MGLKDVLPLLAAADMMVPDMPNVKIESHRTYELTPKQWAKRKSKLKQQRLSRKINRRHAA